MELLLFLSYDSQNSISVVALLAIFNRLWIWLRYNQNPTRSPLWLPIHVGTVCRFMWEHLVHCIYIYGWCDSQLWWSYKSCPNTTAFQCGRALHDCQSCAHNWMWCKFLLYWDLSCLGKHFMNIKSKASHFIGSRGQVGCTEWITLQQWALWGIAYSSDTDPRKKSLTLKCDAWWYVG